MLVEMGQEGVVVPFVFSRDNGGIDMGGTSEVVVELEILGGTGAGMKLQVHDSWCLHRPDRSLCRANKRERARKRTQRRRGGRRKVIGSDLQTDFCFVCWTEKRRKAIRRYNGRKRVKGAKKRRRVKEGKSETA